MPSRHHLYHMYSASESEEEEEKEDEINEVEEYKRECNAMWDIVYYTCALKEEFLVSHSRVIDEDIWNSPKYYRSVQSLLAPYVKPEVFNTSYASGSINKYEFDTIMYYANGWCELSGAKDIFWVAKCIIEFVGI